MKSAVLVLALLVAVASALRAPAVREPELAPELPGSLARLYSPQAPGPVYLQRMLGTAATLSGIAADLLEADVDNAQIALERLRGQYAELAGLVPEWEPRFPLAPIEALGAALAAGDAERGLQAVDALGHVCHECHLDTMVAVQQAYRWGRFTDVTCAEPASGRELGYVRLMRDLDLALSGIAADVAQGQRAPAQAYFRLLRARFDQLEQSCLACHAGRREYYVDASVQAQLEKLGGALATDPVDPGRVVDLIQDIGERSCGRCHLVHMPAAMAQARAAR